MQARAITRNNSAMACYGCRNQSMKPREFGNYVRIWLKLHKTSMRRADKHAIDAAVAHRPCNRETTFNLQQLQYAASKMPFSSLQ